MCAAFTHRRGRRKKKGSCDFKGHSHFGERTNRGFGIRAKLVLMEGFVSWFLWSAKFLSSNWRGVDEETLSGHCNKTEM